MTDRLVLTTLLGFALAAPAAQTLESAYRTSGSAVHAAFAEVQEVLQTGSAVIRRGREELTFGTVISIDGYILTKASELGEIEGLSVTVNREVFDEVSLIAEDPTWDVALIKVAATGLVPVKLAAMEDPEQGIWVVANGATSRSTRRVQVGVIAANAREVFARGGTVLGISIREGDGALTIDKITEGSGAESAGILPGDVLISIEGTDLDEFQTLLDDLKQRRVGEQVTIRVGRGEETLDLEVTLKGRVDLFGEDADRNDAMSGEYSERRTGFPRVIQHDIIGSRHFMGGPVFNLAGECVGMNIARFSRCETYAIPSRELDEIARGMLLEARH